NGVPEFEERASAYGLDIPDHSTQAAFFDYDLDGDLDMFLLNHNIDPGKTESNLGNLLHAKSEFSSNKLFQNRNNYFHDISEESGILNNGIGYGLGVAVGDLNNDFWPDLVIGMDYSERDHMYINQGDGSFKEAMNTATNHISNFSMGNDLADINNDGYMDFISVDMVSNSNYDLKTNMSGMNPKRFYGLVEKGLHHQYMFNTLQLNNGNMLNGNTPAFSEIAQFSGVAATNWSWAPLFFDMDNDGWQDLFVSNGVVRSFRNNDFILYKRKRTAQLYEDLEKYDQRDSLISDYYRELLAKMPEKKEVNLLYRNNRDFTFTEQNDSWQLNKASITNGAIYVDLDNDGDLDIVGNNINETAYLYKNNARELNTESYFIKLEFKGPSQNRFGIGVKVVLQTENASQTKELYTSRGFQSAISPSLHFGVGNESIVTKIIVQWPDGKQEILKNIRANQTLLVDYRNASPVKSLKEKNNTRLFRTDNKLSGLFTHSENPFDDFQKEVLLPHRYSQSGPALAIGDVNNDGLDDFFIGGASGQAATLSIQQEDSTFKITNKSIWRADKFHEDIAAKFFDADNDGDLDIYVASGGNEKENHNSYYKDRLYENLGDGHFKKTSKALPHFAISGSCVEAADYDGDGDFDLFVGGRTVPGQYPVAASSKILKNESEQGKIHFVDATMEVADFLEDFGMVTAAAWSDIDNDNDLDLLLTGEWMPITVIENRNGHLSNITSKTTLSNSMGWWYSLGLADFDQDGDLDIIAGNLGKNYKYKATMDEPFEVYASDFDKSGSLDIVLGYYEEGKVYPLRGRQCSSQQMPFIKEKFSSYDEFGSADLIKVYGTESLNSALHYKANTFSSMYIENLGGFQFKIKELPTLAQFSSINSIVIDDFNSDGNLDAVLSGNLYQSEVETTRNDASYGVMLSGNGDGSFNQLFSYESGLFVKGDVKHAQKLMNTSSNEKYILFAKNNEPIQLVAW
ncbi:MAG: VCBS repeat-containing protein, partial [Flavobacteriaceae bacterium]